jgi:Mrp family chromosome partitioning ATPase
VVAAGPAVSNCSDLLASHLSGLLEEFRTRFEMVYVDCPPVLGFADSMIIGPAVDAVLVVARAASTPREFVRAAIEQLRRVRSNVAGVVLNGVSANVSQYYRYYRDYTRYYSDGDSSPESSL